MQRSTDQKVALRRPHSRWCSRRPAHVGKSGDEVDPVCTAVRTAEAARDKAVRLTASAREVDAGSGAHRDGGVEPRDARFLPATSSEAAGERGRSGQSPRYLFRHLLSPRALCASHSSAVRSPRSSRSTRRHRCLRQPGSGGGGDPGGASRANAREGSTGGERDGTGRASGLSQCGPEPL